MTDEPFGLRWTRVVLAFACIAALCSTGTLLMGDVKAASEGDPAAVDGAAIADERIAESALHPVFSQIRSFITSFGVADIFPLDALFVDTSSPFDRTKQLILALLFGQIDISSLNGTHGESTRPGPQSSARDGTADLIRHPQWTYSQQSDQRPDELDYMVILLSLTTVVISTGVVVYRRFVEPIPKQRTVEANAEDRESRLSDKERVRRLVEENGGRMKQARIVEEVDWSKAKVSRLLSQLDEEDEITKLRIGRENLICLRGHEPAASRSSLNGERN